MIQPCPDLLLCVRVIRIIEIAFYQRREYGVPVEDSGISHPLLPPERQLVDFQIGHRGELLLHTVFIIYSVAVIIAAGCPDDAGGQKYKYQYEYQFKASILFVVMVHDIYRPAAHGLKVHSSTAGHNHTYIEPDSGTFLDLQSVFILCRRQVNR